MDLRAVWALPGIEPRRPCPAGRDQVLTEVSHSPWMETSLRNHAVQTYLRPLRRAL